MAFNCPLSDDCMNFMYAEGGRKQIRTQSGRDSSLEIPADVC